MIEGDMELEEVEALLKVYKKNTIIDPLFLDDELLRQGTLIGRYGEAVATAVRLRDKHASILNTQLRDSYVSENGKDPSVSYMDSAIAKDKKYIELCYLKNRCESALDAMKARGHSLSKICDLAQSSYFSMPKTPRNYTTDRWRAEVESVKDYTEEQIQHLNKTKPKMKKKDK